MDRGVRLQGWNRRRPSGVLLALVLVALALMVPASTAGRTPAGSTAAKAKPTGKPLVIGAAIGLTGGIAAFDLPALTGAQLAVQEINAAGGVLGRPLKIITADTKSDITQGSRAGLEVIQRGAEAMLVSPDYDFGGGAAREAQKAGIVVISSSAGSPKFGVQGIGPLAYTMGIAATTDGAVAAEWGIQKKKFKTGYLLLDTIADYNKEQCRGFETRWKELGGKIIGKDTFKNSDPSVATQVTRIKGLASPPDLIMLCSFPPGGSVAVKQIRNAGINSAIISNNGFDGDFWYKNSMPNLTNFFYTNQVSLWGNDPNPVVNAFVKKFKKLKGQPQAASSIGAYAGIYALARAMKRAGTTKGSAVAAQLDKFSNTSVGGLQVSFTKTRHIDTHSKERIIEVDKGKHRVVYVGAAKKQLPVLGG